MKYAIGYVLSVGALIVAGLYGWVHNIILLAGMDLHTLNGVMILRIVGIFVPPLGAVMGYV